MPRRALVCRVVPSVENPVTIAHEHEDLLGWCEEVDVEVVTPWEIEEYASHL